MLTISNIRGSVVGGEYRLSAQVSSDNPSGLGPMQHEMFFSVPEADRGFVNPERADCFLLGILYFAMLREEDISVDGTVSGQLLSVLASDIMPLLHIYRPKLKPVRIAAARTKRFPGGSGVGTGFSGGVDSLFTIYDNFQQPLEPEEKVNALFCFNAGTHGLGDSVEQLASTETKFRERFRTFQPAADKMQIPLIPVDSNVHSFLPENILPAITLINVSLIYFVSAGLRRYLIASSGYNYEEVLDLYRHMKKHPIDGMGAMDPLLLGPFSLPTLQISSSGAEKARIQKIKLLADIPLTGEFLNVCNSVDVVERNCSICLKCRRTMTDLEILGKLDVYRPSFDIDRYRREFKSRDFATMLYPSRYDHFALQTHNYAVTNHVDLVSETTFMDRFCARLNGTWLYHWLKKKNLLGAAKRLIGRK